MCENKEYSLVIVKPDGVRDNRINEVLTFFQSKGFTCIKSVSKKLTKATVDSIFTSKHNGAFYKRYMTSGETVAFLMQGEKGFDRCRVLKSELRRQYGVENEIENICHTPESGNEYALQLRFFFPELCNAQYQLYCDEYCKVYASSDYACMKEYLDSYKNETNARLIYVFGNEEMAENMNNISRYYSEGTAINEYLGVEYLISLGKEKLRIIGYYNTCALKDFQCENVYVYRSIPEVIELVKTNNGIAVWGYNKLETAMKYFDEYCLDGVIVYHPFYTIKETEVLREYAENYKLLSLGGSGGVHPGECSISYELFRQFANSERWRSKKQV